MDNDELTQMLEEHDKWLKGLGGARADLSMSDLSWANLSMSDLSRANLHEANLFRANLYRAYLYMANLYRADLSMSDLSRANLHEANLCRANLSRANLYGANLAGADLSNTCLDPNNKPNGDCKGFKSIGHGYIIGYRTRQTSAAGKTLVDGRTYGAEVFSTADTECHPGWYLWPTLEAARAFSWRVEFVKVKTKKSAIHKAGSKWRAQWIEVLEEVT